MLCIIQINCKVDKRFPATFWANPFYDDIIVFLDKVPSSQDKLKPIDTTLGIFQLYEKNNVTEFKRNLQERLKVKSKPNWAYKNDLFMAVNITGTKSDVYDKDLDNLLKTLFDTLKGIVFLDDRQIIKLTAEKQITDKIKGVMIALKELSPTDNIQLCPGVYTSGEDIWVKEREQKVLRGQETYFDRY